MPKSGNKLWQELRSLKKRKGLSYKDIFDNLKKRANENSKAVPYDDPHSVSRFFHGTRTPPRSKLLLILTWGFGITDLGEINKVLKLAKYEPLSKKEIGDFQFASTVRQSGVRADKSRTPTAASDAVPVDDTTGIIQIGDEWHTLRDSAALHTLMGRSEQGGMLYLVCINPQAFMSWRQRIETALCDGVKLRLAYVDVEHATSAGKAAEWYAASMCIDGKHIASKSTRANLIELSMSIDKARRRTGADPDVQIYRSSFPHPFLCAIYSGAPASSKAHQGWGLVSSYLMFTEATQSHNFGVLFAEPGTMYDRYLSSVRSYFDFLEKNAVRDHFGSRGGKKSKLP